MNLENVISFTLYQSGNKLIDITQLIHEEEKEEDIMDMSVKVDTFPSGIIEIGVSVLYRDGSKCVFSYGGMDIVYRVQQLVKEK